MKTTQELAQIVLNKRNSLNPLIMPGQLVNEIGSDGLQEALRRRWLIADHDSGFLQVNNQLGVVEELRQSAEICEDCGCKECKCKEKADESRNPSPSHQYVVEHARIGPSVYIAEIAAPGTGHPSPSAAPAAPVAPVAPVTPVAPTSHREPQAEIGDSVMVTQEGKAYTGVVAGAKDGRFTISFGTERPPRELAYTPDQVKLVQKAKPIVQ